MNHLISMTRNVVFAVVICGLPCLAKTPSGTLQVDVNNYVLYNYDTFDTTQFAMNPSATSVPMKTYNFHISIGDIVAVGGKPARSEPAGSLPAVPPALSEPSEGSASALKAARSARVPAARAVACPEGALRTPPCSSDQPTIAQAPACSQKDAENSRRTEPLTASLKSNDIDNCYADD